MTDDADYRDGYGKKYRSIVMWANVFLISWAST